MKLKHTKCWKNISNTALFIQKREECYKIREIKLSYTKVLFSSIQNKNVKEGIASKPNFKGLKYNFVIKVFKFQLPLVLWPYFNQLWGMLQDKQ